MLDAAVPVAPPVKGDSVDAEVIRFMGSSSTLRIVCPETSPIRVIVAMLMCCPFSFCLEEAPDSSGCETKRDWHSSVVSALIDQMFYRCAF
jgi:hypothetical protein